MHEEYIRKVDGAKSAVLFVHGILGTPDRYRKYIEAAPDNWSIYNILLDGHGSTVDAFSKTSMIKWHTQIVDTIEKLRAQYDNIVIVAHSLGALLAIDSAVLNPTKIKGMLLLAVPLDIWVSFGAMITSVKVATGHANESDVFEKTMKDGYSVDQDKKLWKYIKWIPRYWELYKEMYRVRKMIPRLTVPTFALQSAKDELVPLSAAKYLAGNEKLKYKFLQNSMHEYYDPADLDFCLKTFSDMCKQS